MNPSNSGNITMQGGAITGKFNFQTKTQGQTFGIDDVGQQLQAATPNASISNPTNPVPAWGANILLNLAKRNYDIKVIYRGQVDMWIAALSQLTPAQYHNVAPPNRDQYQIGTVNESELYSFLYDTERLIESTITKGLGGKDPVYPVKWAPVDEDPRIKIQLATKPMDANDSTVPQPSNPLGAQTSIDHWLAAPGDRNPDGFVYEPLGVGIGPAFKKTMNVSPFGGGGWAWYSQIR